jgi:mRNA interferase YafQ
MYEINYTNTFKKSLKRMKKRGYDMALFEEVSQLLQENGSLPAIYSPHKLSGKLAGF